MPGPTATTPAAWHKADAISASDNDPLTQWDDSSGNARHITGGSPLYKTNILNGLPVVRFDGVDDKFESIFTLNHPTTLIAVLAWRSAYSSNESAIDGQTLINSLRLVRTSSTDMAAYAGGAGGLQIATTPQDFHTYTSVFTGSACSFRIDGGTEDTTSAAANNPGGLAVGGETNNTEYADVDIAEVLVYASDLGSERGDVEAYLTAKWFAVATDPPSLYQVRSPLRLA